MPKITIVLLLLLAQQWALGAVPDPPKIHLSDLRTQAEISGLRFESDELRRSMEKDVQDYFDYLKHPGNHPLKTRCLQQSKEPASPFCLFVLNPKFGKRGEISPQLRKERQRTNAALNRMLRASKWGQILRFSKKFKDNDLIQLLRQASPVHSIVRFSDYAIKHGTCSQGPLFVALGMRLETEFPSSEARSRVLSLYQKTFDCSLKTQATVTSGYRLGIFHVGENRCDLAEEVFFKNSRSRAFSPSTGSSHENRLLALILFDPVQELRGNGRH
jgi:hypothetical protein